MKLIQGEPNEVVFLLVSKQDFITPEETEDVTVFTSEAGGPFERFAGEVTPIGSGWYHMTYAPTETPVILRAYSENSAEWRDIHEIMKPSDNIAELTARVEALAEEFSRRSTELFVGFNDLREEVRKLAQASGGRWSHNLTGDPVLGEAPVLSTGGLRSGDPLLEPGETLGANVLPEAWGRYDSAGGSTVLSSGPNGITIQYGIEGSNQQVWKNPNGLLGGDYVLEFDLASKGNGRALVEVMLHRSPYTNLGLAREVEAGKHRMRIGLQETDQVVRVRWAFGGKYTPIEVYDIDGVSLRRITK